MMASIISCAEKRIARLHNNAVLTNDDQDRCLTLFNKYFFKKTNSLLQIII